MPPSPRSVEASWVLEFKQNLQLCAPAASEAASNKPSLTSVVASMPSLLTRSRLSERRRRPARAREPDRVRHHAGPDRAHGGGRAAGQGPHPGAVRQLRGGHPISRSLLGVCFRSCFLPPCFFSASSLPFFLSTFFFSYILCFCLPFFLSVSLFVFLCVVPSSCPFYFLSSCLPAIPFFLSIFFWLFFHSFFLSSLSLPVVSVFILRHHTKYDLLGQGCAVQVWHQTLCLKPAL